MKRVCRQVWQSKLCLAVAALSLIAGGCPPQPREKIVLHATPVVDGSTSASAMFRLRFTFIRHRIPNARETDEFWRILDEGILPAEAAGLWKKNDLRVGVGGQIAIDRLNHLLTTEAQDFTFAQKDVQLREDIEITVAPAGPPTFPSAPDVAPEEIEEVVHLLYENEDGQTIGRTFSAPNCRMVIKCRPDPDAPDHTLIRLCPQVEYGKQETRFVRMPGGVRTHTARPRFTFGFLATEVRVPPGHILVLGGRQTSPLSLGGYFFFDRQATETWSRTVVIVPERFTIEPKAK